MFKYFMVIIYLAFISLNFTNQVQATPNKKVQITVGEWPPFISSQQKQNGFIANLIEDVFKASGYQVNFTFYPWTRAYKTAAIGRADATAVWMHKSEREQDFYYSEPVLNEEFVFFYLEGNSFDWANLKDLRVYKLGGLLGSSYGAAFDKALADKHIQAEFVPNTKLNFLNLLAGRVDAFPLEKSVGLASIRNLLTPEQQARIRFHPKRLLQNHSFLLLPKALKNSQNLMLDFNETLAKFKQSGRYQAYFDRFEAGEYELAQ